MGELPDEPDDSEEPEPDEPLLPLEPELPDDGLLPEQPGKQTTITSSKSPTLVHNRPLDQLHY